MQVGFSIAGSQNHLSNIVLLNCELEPDIVDAQRQPRAVRLSSLAQLFRFLKPLRSNIKSTKVV